MGLKLMVKLCMLVLMLGVGAPFFIQGPNGQPMFSAKTFMPDVAALQAAPSDLMASASSKMASLKSSFQSETASSQPTKVYKWQDASGVWHYSETPNAAGEGEEILIDPNTNIVQAVAVAEKQPEAKPNKTAKMTLPSFSPTTISPKQIGQLMQDAKQLQSISQERAGQLNGI